MSKNSQVISSSNLKQPVSLQSMPFGSTPAAPVKPHRESPDQRARLTKSLSERAPSRRATNHRDRSNTAGRISYYQSAPSNSQVLWTNKKFFSANNEPLGKRPVQPSVAAVTETASTSAQPTVEQQLPLQTLTLSEETPSLTMVLRVIM